MKDILNGRMIFVLLVTAASIFFVWPTLSYYRFVQSADSELLQRDLAALSDDEREERLDFERRRMERLESANMIRLGLDLQGGVDLLIEVDTDGLEVRKLESLAAAMRAGFRNRIVAARVSVDPDARRVLLSLDNPAEDINIAREVLEEFANEVDHGDTGILRTGELAITRSADVIRMDRNDAVEAALRTIRQRVDEYGLTQPIVVRQGAERIRVQIPGEADPDRIARNLMRMANLEFRMLHPEHQRVVAPFIRPETFMPGINTGIIRDEFLEEYEIEDVIGTQVRLRRDIPGLPPGYRLFLGRHTRSNMDGTTTITENLAYVLTANTDLTGDNLRRAAMVTDTMDIRDPYKVTLQFDNEGTEAFARITSENVGRQFAMLLDNMVISAPNIREPILFGRSEISGGFGQQEAVDLALTLKAGSLPAPLRIVQQQSIGASLGRDSIIASGQALLIGAAFLVILMISVYRVAGMFAIMAMILNVLLILGVLSLGGGTLTLSGIGGILLTMGMAVDANVLIYERLREELATGKPLRAALNQAFSRAFTVILDSNITSLLPALVLILFEIVDGPTRGFWTALAIGLFVNLYTGLTVTRALIESWVIKRKKFDVGKVHLFKDSKFDFMAYRKWGYPISGALLGVGLFYLLVHGVNPGIDFTGGVLATVEDRSGQVARADIQRAVAGVDAFHDTRVVAVLNSNEYQITVPAGEGLTPEDIRDKVQTALSSEFGDAIAVVAFSAVDSTVGDEFKVTAFLTVLVASLVILGYIAIRFKPIFGVAAVVALLHDLLLTLGIFVFLGRSVSLEIVSALLITLGYSVNDTIVIFDRIRETMANSYGRPMRDIINEGINRTLARTVFTSSTTLIAVLAMLIFGGIGLKDFALVLLIGILTGTYSSIFVASALIDSYMLSREKKLGAAKAHGQIKKVRVGAQ